MKISEIANEVSGRMFVIYDTIERSSAARKYVTNKEIGLLYDTMVLLEKIEVRLKNHAL